MIRITINNYQYFYNEKTKVLFHDVECTKEVPKNLFTAQETLQFYNELRTKLYS